MNISEYISQQFPFFIRENNPNFVEFLEAYYEWLNGAGYTPSDIQDWSDIDKTLDQFKSSLYQTFLNNFPANIRTSKDLILKHAKEFYRSKGSEKSIEFLIRVMFDTDVSFYYPKKDILRVSDGKWYIQTSIRIGEVFVDDVPYDDPNIFTNTRIVGQITNASATVDSIETFYVGGAIVNELNVSSIAGVFEQGEDIIATKDGKTIRSHILSSEVISIVVDNPGSGYQVGQPAILVSDSGSGANAIISLVSTGNVGGISLISGGAGYQANNYLLFTAPVGSGANAYISSVDTSGKVHANSYNVYWQTVSLEANTPIGNTIYSNVNPSVTDPANTPMSNVLSAWVYSNTGPANSVTLVLHGQDYTSVPSLSVIANTVIQSLGILGRMNIEQPGINYSVNDVIRIDNTYGAWGAGAQARVSNVSNTGAITEVRWVKEDGFQEGGDGYSQFILPTATVLSNTGTNAIIKVTNTLGYGAEFRIANTTLGAIQRITVITGGFGYNTAPTVAFNGFGDGTAVAHSEISQGIKTYPGRWLNDDGHISGYNFIEDRDYYQNYSYVLRLDQSLEKFADVLKSLVHPGGMKLFSEFLKDTNSYQININTNPSLHSTIFSNVAYVIPANSDNMKILMNLTSYVFDFIALSNVTSNTVRNDFANTLITTTSNTLQAPIHTVSNVLVLNAGRGYSNTKLYSNSGAYLGLTLNSNGSIVNIDTNGRDSNGISYIFGTDNTWTIGSNTSKAIMQFDSANTLNITTTGTLTLELINS